nr:hypothetical protein [Chloroflexota bacterium]
MRFSLCPPLSSSLTGLQDLSGLEVHYNQAIGSRQVARHPLFAGHGSPACCAFAEAAPTPPQAAGFAPGGQQSAVIPGVGCCPRQAGTSGIEIPG